MSEPSDELATCPGCTVSAWICSSYCDPAKDKSMTDSLTLLHTLKKKRLKIFRLGAKWK